MKIALNKMKSEKKKHHSKKISSAKRTYQIKTAKLVQVFAARWRSIRKYFNSPENKRLEKNDARYINIIEKTPHAYTQKENPWKN